MQTKCLFLIGRKPPTDDAGLVFEVLRAPSTWSVNPHLPVRSLAIEQLIDDPALLDACAVAWIILDKPKVEGLYDIVAMLQDRQVPGMITRPQEVHHIGETFLEGVVTAPPQSPPASVTAVLRTLWSQAGVLNAMKIELSIMRLHSDGVVNQFGKIDEELRLAAQLQHDFLPAQLPKECGIEFNVLFRPAGYVSGDIYDIKQLDDHHIGFFLADAVGHGVPAALMTVYIKSSLTVRETSQTGDCDNRIIPPNEAMARLNRDIVDYQVGQIRTATAVYGVINTDTHQVQIARAGHPYPIILHGDGTTEFVDPQGAMLGVFPDESFELAHLQLNQGDRLLFFSDGFELAFPRISDNKPSGPTIANRQYLNVFKDLFHGPMDRVMDRLAAKLDHQVGSLNQHDDLTALLVGVG